MEKRVLNEEILKEELTPEQYERFKKAEACQGLEQAVFTLPNMDDEGKVVSALNQRIKELRIENGLSQNDLANILDISQKEYWRCEQAGYSMNILRLAEIAIFYNVSIDWLSGYYPTRKPFFPEGGVTKVNGHSLEEIKASKAAKKSN